MTKRSDIRLGIVCPMANERATAVEFVDAVLGECGGFDSVRFLAVLDHACTDGTVDVLREHAETVGELEVVWAPENTCVVDGYTNGYKAALEAGLIPILCLGEKLKQREEGITKKVIKTQFSECLNGIFIDGPDDMIIAYEPVWAIGTGKNATPEQAQEVHAQIRELISKKYTADIAAGFRIQYGGSMKPDNAASLLSMPDIDGGLIGGASLKADAFIGIIKAA